jgi:iron(III) transport system ATP-binding protein
VAVRPESIMVSAEQPANGFNVLRGQVEKSVFLGDFIDCQIRVGEQLVHVKLAPTSDLSDADKVFLQFAAHACIVLPTAD